MFVSFFSSVKPGLEFISRNDIMITLNIRCPKRVSYSNGKFELTSVIIVVGQQKLKKMTSQFEAIHSVTLELPPRAKTVTEYLKVVACYSDGREEASDGLEVLLPTYGKHTVKNVRTFLGRVKLSIVSG